MKFKNKIICGDSLEVLKDFDENCIDSMITDPPYGLAFMNKRWDYNVPKKELWAECLRVLKPGGHALIFGGTRTFHRLVVEIEDAGFEIRDTIVWHYAEGFPKNHNLGNGQGTALKPATELICLARKPISEKTIASNVLKWGCGGINIDKSRIKHNDDIPVFDIKDKDRFRKLREGLKERHNTVKRTGEFTNEGRWPANVIFDEKMAEELDRQSGNSKSGEIKDTHKCNDIDGYKPSKVYGKYRSIKQNSPSSSGGASRFFFVAKPSKSEKNHGCENLEVKQTTDGRKKDIDNAYQRGKTLRNNFHPTVKPIMLMKYLVNMITPVGGIVLDPFIGSGTTAISAKELFLNYVGIEKDPDYVKIAESRLRQGYLVDIM